jgi:hypothetical protein
VSGDEALVLEIQSVSTWVKPAPMEPVAVIDMTYQDLGQRLGLEWEPLNDPNDPSPFVAAYLAVDGRSEFVLEAAPYAEPDEGVTLYGPGDFARARHRFLVASGLPATAFGDIREGELWYTLYKP